MKDLSGLDRPRQRILKIAIVCQVDFFFLWRYYRGERQRAICIHASRCVTLVELGNAILVHPCLEFSRRRVEFGVRDHRLGDTSGLGGIQPLVGLP